MDDNKIDFQIYLVVQGVTIRGDDIEYYTKRKVKGPQIVKELVWFGVDKQENKYLSEH